MLHLYLLFFQKDGCFSTYFLTSIPTNHQIIFEALKVILSKPMFKNFLACQAPPWERERGGCGVGWGVEGASFDTIMSKQVNKSEKLQPHRKKFPKVGNLALGPSRNSGKTCFSYGKILLVACYFLLVACYFHRMS